MIKLYFNRYSKQLDDYLDDINRMKRILAERGYSATANDLYKAWSAHSAASSAGWLLLPWDNETLFHIVTTYLSEAPYAD